MAEKREDLIFLPPTVPKKGPVTEHLMSVDERIRAESRDKAEKIAAANPGTRKYGLHVVTRVCVDTEGRLVCNITGPGIPDGANPFIFINPPVRVPDGVDVDEDGEEIEKFREDPRAALEAIVADVVSSLTETG